MMTPKQIDNATLDELNEELAAGGMPSGETDVASARKSVRSLIAEFAKTAEISAQKSQKSPK